MKKFMDEDFLLNSETAKRLYHEVAEKMPIIDYHCHLDPKDIALNRGFEDLSEVWLSGDHYKWRLLRAYGIKEELVTGGAQGIDKFKAFGEIMPSLIGNPMYHWSHLELKRGFGVEETLNSENAEEIFNITKEKLKNLRARDFIRMFNVKALCTTDDPIDDLQYHQMMAKDESMADIKVLPAFRPDKALNIDKKGFKDYIGKLAEVCEKQINGIEDLVECLLKRIEYFDVNGCKCADHGLDYIPYEDVDIDVVNKALIKALNDEPLSKPEADMYKTLLLKECAKKYSELDWVMQLHFGVMRDNNTREVGVMGPDHGHDAIRSASGVDKLSPLLNCFNENDGLPKTIIYSLNPNDNTAIATIMAAFQGGDKPGRIHQGSAWWFNDSIGGMESQLKELAANGVLGRFPGMLTDSRSFLSYTRHEYFRRILCNLIGGWVEEGLYPNDYDALRKMVEDLCFNNTNRLFGFDVEGV